MEKLNTGRTRTKGERAKRRKEMGRKTPVLRRAAGSSAQPNEGRGIPLVLYRQPRTRECQLSAPSLLGSHTCMPKHTLTHNEGCRDAGARGEMFGKPWKDHSATVVHRSAEKALFLFRPSLAEYHHVG